jgi:5-methyltetrahydrofolate--homocysteine methyltransferase
VEDALLCRRPDASERLLSLALELKDTPDTLRETGNAAASWRDGNAEERVVQAVVRGIDGFLADDLRELRQKYAEPLDIVEGVLMRGMREVGERFGAGKMFLPQVIRSARVMNQAVAILDLAKASRQGGSGVAKILLATVKGDVHDIGKNIVGIVLVYNGYEVLDLGVMVPAETIIETAVREQVSVIGLSGLISLSLDEMARVARELEQRGLFNPCSLAGQRQALPIPRSG